MAQFISPESRLCVQDQTAAPLLASWLLAGLRALIRGSYRLLRPYDFLREKSGLKVIIHFLFYWRQAIPNVYKQSHDISS